MAPSLTPPDHGTTNDTTPPRQSQPQQHDISSPLNNGTTNDTTPPRQSQPQQRDIGSPLNNGTDPAILTFLMTQISTLQETIAAMTVQMSSLQKGRDVKDKDGAPEMHIKDVEKPSKFHGDKWLTWEDEFTTFLTRRDRRWKEVLAAIKAKSDKPLSPDGLDALRMDPTITAYMAKKEVFEAFKDQLYEYLKAFTSGDIHTMVLSNGVENSMES